MTTVPLEIRLTSDELLLAVRRLPSSDLEQFVSQVLVVQAQRKAPSLPQAEAELLLKINRGLPADVQSRYISLIEKRQAVTLSPEEHEELLRLTEQVEQFEVQRLTALADLARLRQVPLNQL